MEKKVIRFKNNIFIFCCNIKKLMNCSNGETRENKFHFRNEVQRRVKNENE